MRGDEDGRGRDVCGDGDRNAVGALRERSFRGGVRQREGPDGGDDGGGAFLHVVEGRGVHCGGLDGRLVRFDLGTGEGAWSGRSGGSRRCYADCVGWSEVGAWCSR